MSAKEQTNSVENNNIDIEMENNNNNNDKNDNDKNDNDNDNGSKTSATTTMERIDSRSFSLKRMATQAITYDIPSDASQTKLKDGFQFGYLITWAIAICLSTSVVIGNWAIIRLFNVEICQIENNHDNSKLNVEFGSFNSFGGLIQQIWLTTVMLGGFGLFYLPQVIGIKKEENNGKTLRNAQISVLLIQLIFQIVINIILVPLVGFNSRSIFNALALLSYFIWGYYYKKCNAIRRLYPLFAVILLTVVIYYMVAVAVFTKLPLSLYAFIYPLYLSLAQSLLLKILEYLDICNCCKGQKNNKDNNNNNNNNENDNETVIDTMYNAKQEIDLSSSSCLDRFWKTVERWRKTAPSNDWPDYYGMFSEVYI